jgi:(2Fe-2S) ferredoxin
MAVDGYGDLRQKSWGVERLECRGPCRRRRTQGLAQRAACPARVTEGVVHCDQEGRNRQMQDETTASTHRDSDLFFDVHIFVCCNRRPDGHARGSCAARGSEALRDYMKARVKEAKIPHARVNMAGCLDRCEDGPCIVIYPEGVWYKIESRSDVDAVIEQHLIGGGRAESLRLAAGRSA